MNKGQLDKILRKHEMWLNGEKGGERADLSRTDISGFNLSLTNLRGAIMIGTNLSYTDLSDTDMKCTNLAGAIMIGTNLSRAIMSGAIMSGAIMNGAILEGTNLSCADLSGAILEEVKFNEYTIFFALVCPEEGSFIGFKKCDKYIVKLLILDDSNYNKLHQASEYTLKRNENLLTAVNGGDSKVKAMISATNTSYIDGTKRAESFLKEKGYCVVDINLNDIRHSGINGRIGPIYLAKRLEKMAECDAIYMCRGWENDEFCKIEKQASELCGLNIIFEEETLE